jgi:hypothetical protein
MDIASGGLAASQISAGQRAQQISIAALKSAQLQTQSIVNVLAGSTAPAKTAQPAGGLPQGGGDAGGQPGGNLRRGSLIDILA